MSSERERSRGFYKSQGHNVRRGSKFPSGGGFIGAYSRYFGRKFGNYKARIAESRRKRLSNWKQFSGRAGRYNP